MAKLVVTLLYNGYVKESKALASLQKMEALLRGLGSTPDGAAEAWCVLP